MRFMTVKMLKEYIQLSKSTIYKMVSSNSIPHIKKGRRTIFEKSQIDNWMLNGESVELPELPKL
jgi:excisionase family DNA binding protein